MKRFFLFTLIILLVAYLGISWHFSNLILHPPQETLIEGVQELKDNPKFDYDRVERFLPAPQDFSVSSSDGTRIKGWFYRADSTNCALILSHGWSKNRLAMFKYVPVFEDCGCHMVFYDHRAHNESGGDYATGGIKEAEDLHTVTKWVQKQTSLRPGQIGWIGASWGGATALQAGAYGDDVAFIISDSPFEDWDAAVMERAIRDYGEWINAFIPTVKLLVGVRAGVRFNDASTVEAAAKVTEPVLLIHSKADAETDSEQSVHIAARLNSERSAFYQTEWGSSHVDDILQKPEEFKQLTYSFLRKYAPNWGGCGR